jgi:serine phosphatase RsbU (regulator of sigma subunit)
MPDGAASMLYAYEPMRDIGGDFLFVRREGEVLHTVLIDVTGHGVGAALTVNRLHGELERQFGVQKDPKPAEVLSGLNAYLHFALASHSVYATAVCFRADPEQSTLEYASAGHPPAFHRTADGRIERLESTTLVLGVVSPEDFEALPRTTDFMRGDAVIAYTDGATEAVTSSGKMIRVDGLERVVMKTVPRQSPSGVASRQGHAPDEPWCAAILAEVHRLRSGPTLDDTLIVEIRSRL